MQFLELVTKEKRKELSEMKKLIKEAEKLKVLGFSGDAYKHLLKRKEEDGFFVIAEIKKASPSSGFIFREMDVLAKAKSYENYGASAISVLTEKNWFFGSLDDLRLASQSVSVPVMMKDFVIDEIQIELALKFGARMVLLIAAILKEKLKEFVNLCLKNGIEPLVETRSFEEIETAVQAGARIIGVNSRNLETLEVDKQIFKELSPSAKKHAKKGVLFVAESGIHKGEEVVEVIELGYSGVLIGSVLSRRGGEEFLKEIFSAKNRR